MRDFIRLRSALARRVLAVSCVIGLAACGKIYVEEGLPNTFELSQGTPVDVELIDPPRAADLAAGQVFEAVLAKPLYYAREQLDPEGQTFETNTLVAPIGAPVAGVAVARPDGDEVAGLQLTSITIHGGMSFPIETTVLDAPAQESPEQAVKTLTFHLSEPADVAMVLDFRDNKNPGAEAN